MDDEKDTRGASLATVKRIEFEVPPPGDELVTVMAATPLAARSDAGTEAISTVLAPYVV